MMVLNKYNKNHYSSCMEKAIGLIVTLWFCNKLFISMRSFRQHLPTIDLTIQSFQPTIEAIIRTRTT